MFLLHLGIFSLGRPQIAQSVGDLVYSMQSFLQHLYPVSAREGFRLTQDCINWVVTLCCNKFTTQFKCQRKECSSSFETDACAKKGCLMLTVRCTICPNMSDTTTGLNFWVQPNTSPPKWVQSLSGLRYHGLLSCVSANPAPPRIWTALGLPQSCRRCAASSGKKSCGGFGCWGPGGRMSRMRRGCPRSPRWRVGFGGRLHPPGPGGAAGGPQGISLGTKTGRSSGRRGDPGCGRTCRCVLRYPSSSLLPLCAWWDYPLLLGDTGAVCGRTYRLYHLL